MPTPKTPPPPGAATVNELVPFLDFVERHPVGTSCTGVVEAYSSHGAYLRVDDVRVYVPLRLMADPPPPSARKVMKMGESATVVIAGFVPARRSIDAGLPGMVDATAQTSESARGSAAKKAAVKKAVPKKTASKKSPAKKAVPKKSAATSAAASPAVPKKAAATKATAKKAAVKKVAAGTTATKKSASKKAVPKKAPTKRATAKPA
ncbi:MAG: hypothetical protein VW396_09270 [Ilumatobacter sp.]